MANLSHLSEGEMKEILMLQERLMLLDTQHKARDSFMEYIRYIWPSFIEGDHHRIIADKLTRVAKGELKRLIVNMPPRHTKSEFASIYFPSWVMGLNPDMKIMQTTHTADLSINFGRKVRNLMDSDEYSNIFSKVLFISKMPPPLSLLLPLQNLILYYTPSAFYSIQVETLLPPGL